MRHLRWQALIVVLGLMLTIGLLVGQSTSPPPIAEVPAVGVGTYSEALIGSPRALNPLLDYLNPVDRDLDRLLFSGLTRFDAFGRATPDLANWLISDDQRTYTFILKPNLTWHDGQPLTADDVAFTVGLMQDPRYPGPDDLKSFWQAVTTTVTGAQTIAFTLPETFAPFLDYTDFGVLPRHLLQEVNAAQLVQAPFNIQPVGSGPFMFERWLAEGDRVTGVTLKAFPNYPGPPPKLEGVEFRFYLNADLALAAYERGEVMGLGRLDKAHLDAALKAPDTNLYAALEPEYSLIFLNLRDETLPFFKDKKVRQALLLGLNRAALVSDILQGQAVVANSPVLPGSWAYNLDLPTLKYDPAQAASLLESAGWTFSQAALPETDTFVRQKNGVPLRFTLIAPDTPVHTALARAAQATWAELGVQVDVATVDPEVVRSQYLEPRAFQAILVDFNLAGTPDPDPYPLWHETQAESGQNYGGFNDRLSSQALEQARITTDVATRARLYQQFQSRFADQVPALLLYYPVYNYVISAKVGGVQVGPLTDASDRFATLADWYVATRRVVIEQPTPTP
jgi:peptide/nickel transport system substrate-binding protein